ncbi:hypothetical protein D3H64_05055 [Atopobacter sp. AH10]|uniref:hypothetical protein n=1 Tax=Atopobacter sp. AH10 TaxID=2315861 RepID=UPI000EF282F9|nr:hypothetical protein [Atopobacter sp. AH10]RLK63352.1 hypothetical protein D3H64_05055 [Atopobacter sp. AH10]
MDRFLRWCFCLSLNVFFSWWIILTLMSLLAGAWLLVGSFLATPFIYALSVFEVIGEHFSLPSLIVSLLLGGIGFCSIYPMLKLTDWLKDRFLDYWRWNKRFVKLSSSEADEEGDCLTLGDRGLFDDEACEDTTYFDEF